MGQLSRSQLESHLWKAAWLLKGPVDAADFKTYVFPLLFFKRLSDVHDKEHETALAEFAGDEEAALFPENYRFQVPEDCHWRDVRKVAVNVGQALQTALRGVEQANPHTLYGIFGDAQWTNKDRLLAACILVFRQKKSKDRKNKVLIVDASKEFKTGRPKNELLPEHVERIHRWYRKYTDVEDIARVVTLDEIAANDHNLNIPRYVEPKIEQEVLTVEEAMKRLHTSAKATFAAEDKLIGLLRTDGLLLQK